MPKITVLMGLPGSGKSYYAEKSMEGSPIRVSSDEIRERIFRDVASQKYNRYVFSIMRLMVEKAIGAGCDVLVDSTNIQRKHRKPWIDIGGRMGIDVVCLFVDPPLEECLKRNAIRERHVPIDVIQQMSAHLEPPNLEEGFKEVCRV